MYISCIVTYQKANGELFFRPYGLTFKKVGDVTSMGWKVVDIHYRYGNNYYCFDDYRKIKIKEHKEQTHKKIIRRIIRVLNHYA